MRPVVPVISAPLDEHSLAADFMHDPFGGRATGLGDPVLLTLLERNADTGTIWGIGPSSIVPAATEDVLGMEEWSAGPTHCGPASAASPAKQRAEMALSGLYDKSARRR